MYRSERLKIPWYNRLNSGGVMTFRGDMPDQAIYWTLIGIARGDADEEINMLPCGEVRWDHTKTDKASLSVNLYKAPSRMPRIRFDTGLLFDNGHLFDEDAPGYFDRLTVSCAVET